jgi:hypothetical protein
VGRSRKRGVTSLIPSYRRAPGACRRPGGTGVPGVICSRDRTLLSPAWTLLWRSDGRRPCGNATRPRDRQRRRATAPRRQLPVLPAGRPSPRWLGLYSVGVHGSIRKLLVDLRERRYPDSPTPVGDACAPVRAEAVADVEATNIIERLRGDNAGALSGAVYGRGSRRSRRHGSR